MPRRSRYDDTQKRRIIEEYLRGVESGKGGGGKILKKYKLTQSTLSAWRRLPGVRNGANGHSEGTDEIQRALERHVAVCQRRLDAAKTALAELRGADAMERR